MDTEIDRPVHDFYVTLSSPDLTTTFPRAEWTYAFPVPSNISFQRWECAVTQINFTLDHADEQLDAEEDEPDNQDGQLIQADEKEVEGELVFWRRYDNQDNSAIIVIRDDFTCMEDVVD